MALLAVSQRIAIAALLFPGSVAAIALPDEPQGPPAVSLMGCSHAREWTVDYVKQATGLSNGALLRVEQKFGFSPQRVCASDPRLIEGMVNPKKPPAKFDEPDKYMAQRVRQLQDSDGTIPPNGLTDALAQRTALIEPPAGGTSKRAERTLTPKSAGISSGSWTWLGPGNIGGRVRAISPDPVTPGRILLGSVSGGIWLTTNTGGTWSVIDDFMPNVAVTSLARDPQVPATIYAGTGEGFFNADAIRGLGIFKSTNNGASWTSVASTNPSNSGVSTDWYYVNRVAVSPTNSQVILAATNNGLYRSADGGTTWTKVYQQVGTSGGVAKFRRVLDVKFHPTDGNIAVLGEGKHSNCVSTCVSDGNGVAYSSDGGVTWTRTKLNTAAISSQLGRVEVAIAQSNPSIVYAVVDMSSGQLYKSTDGGLSWVPNAPVSTPAHLSSQGWYNNALWVAPNDPNRVIIGGVNLKMSIDGGTTWASLSSVPHVDHHALVSDPGYASNFTLYDGNDGGIYKATGANTATPSTSSPSWTSLNNNLGITQFYGGAGKPGGRILGGSQDNGSVMWTGTTNWVKIWGSDGGNSAADQADGNYVYSMTQYGGVVRYTQALLASPPANASQYICTGITDASCNFNNSAPKLLFIPPMVMDPITNTTLYLGAQNLWRTTNAKDSVNTNVAWSIVKTPRPTNAYGLIPYIAAIAIAPGNSDLVWVGYDDGQVACTMNATAASPTWSAVTMPSATSLRYATSISFDPSNTNRVFVTFGGYLASTPGTNVWVTTSGCGTSPVWTNIHNQLPLAPIRALAVHPNNPSWLYAGTEVGVFASQNGGANWSTTNDGPGTASVEELFFLDSTTLVAATHGRGMFTAQALPGSAPTITSAPPPNGSVGVAYTFNYTANGSPAPTFSLTAGTFPPGLTLNGATGVLSGTPTTNGSYNGTVTATNTSGSATQDFLISTLGAPPGAPTIGTATPGNGQATVSFTPPASSGGSAITSYTVTCGAFSASGAASPITVSGLTNGTSYGCYARATNSGGTGSPSATVSVTPVGVPGAPTIGTATPGNTQATVAFTAPASNGGSAITSYTMTCGAFSASGAASPITVTGLANGTSYSCAATATNAIGTGPASASVSVTPVGVPGAPTIGTATPGNGQATVSFTPPASNGGSAVTSYTMTCGAFSASGAASPITVTGLTNGTGYSCTVTATNSAGTGAASGSVSVTPVGVPGAPTIGTATPGNGQATVAFTPPGSNGGSAITGYTMSCGAFSASGAASPITVTGLTNGTSYSCTVTATNAAGTGAASGSVSVTPSTVPGAPTIGTATAGNGQAAVSFTAPASNGGSAITGYTATCGAFVASGAASPITVTGLANGTLYSCSVTATNANGTGSPSGSASVTPATVPSAPAIGTATPGNAQATVTFTPPSSNGGAAITGYTVTCGVVSASGAASPITVTGLSNGTPYSCAVKATNSAGPGASSGNVSVTPATVPGAPTIGTGTPGDGQATVTFTPPASNGGSAITGYTVTCGAFSSNGAASPITVAGLTNGTTYSCSAKATNAAGTGPSSGNVSVTPAPAIGPPGAPTIGTATPGNAQATVSFSAPASNGGSAITGYTMSCGAFSASGAASPITVTGLANGTTYSCTVTATNAAGTGAPSSSVSVTPATVPGAPTIGTGTPGNGQATVSFTAPASNGGSAITGYTVTCGAFSASGAASPITVTGLTNGTAYSCSAKATNSAGTGAASATVSVTPVGLPGAPTIGTATPGNGQATVSFTAPASNGGSPITGYTMSCGAFTASGATSPITVTGLTNGTSYSCTVTATNSAGTGAASGSVSVTPATVPGAPTIGTASPGNGQATVSFTAPASNGGSAITGYTVTCGAFSASGAASPITVTGLANGATYSCNAKATNSAGTGAASGNVSVTPVGPPNAPTIGTATPGNGQATVSFTPPAFNGGSAITGYTVTCGAFSASGAASPITVAGLANGTTYSCAATATNAAGTGAASASVGVTPATVPGAPTIGSATPGNGQATVSFTAPASNGGAAITAYTATCGAFSASAAASPITVAGLTNNIAYNCSVTATNSVGTGAASGTTSVMPSSGITLAMLTVVSRKSHAPAGTFDLPIDTTKPVTGNVTVEPRQIGAGHKLVFTFNDVIGATGTVTAVDQNNAAVGTATAVAVGSTVEVTLTGVPDAKRVKVTLTGVNGTLTTSASIGFLVGDVNNSYSVTSSDVLMVNGRVGLPTSASTFIFDLNASSSVTITDASIVKAQSGQILP